MDVECVLFFIVRSLSRVDGISTPFGMAIFNHTQCWKIATYLLIQIFEWNETIEEINELQRERERRRWESQIHNLKQKPTAAFKPCNKSMTWRALITVVKMNLDLIFMRMLLHSLCMNVLSMCDISSSCCCCISIIWRCQNPYLLLSFCMRVCLFML